MLFRSEAMASHRQVGLTLLTALDLPWVRDGHQRDGAHVQPPVDAIVRRALVMHAQPFAVVAGQGADRVSAGLQAVQHWLQAPTLPLTLPMVLSRNKSAISFAVERK